MPTIKYPKNPNIETAFVEQDDGTKNRVVMTAPQDISTLEYPSNPNSTKGYVTVDGKKQRVIMVADIVGGGGGGAFTYFNCQKGDVVLSIPDAVQYSTMPTAASTNEGDIVQFTGTTDANYTNGYFYKCVSDGQNPATYSWTQVNVQPAPSGLPDQTGQSGKFLITDGTNASWSDKPLVNKAKNNETNTLNVYGDASQNLTFGSSVFIGYKSAAYGFGTISGDNATAVGSRAKAANNATAIGSTAESSNNGTSVGYGAEAKAAGAIGIGIYARTNAQNAIQLGSTGSVTTNSDANTFKVANANGNFELMSADGTIPTARLTKVNSTITLTAAGWSSNTQTVTVSGITSTGVVLVSPDPTDQADYTSAGIICTSQATDSLVFTCSTTPTSDIDVVVVML